jgi:uncharacterized pyridoxamine 5'-phosphate oxidase family protein
MKEVLDFLNKVGTYYLATTEGDQPRVRPIGFVMDYNGKLAFGTANTKKMYKQIVANPKIEICGYDGEGNTLRLYGKAVFATSDETQQKALEIVPMLKDIYSVGDGIFEVFYLDEGKAVFSDMSGASRELDV